MSVPLNSLDSDSSSVKVDRRQFFSWLTLAWVTFAGAVTLTVCAFMRFMYPNVLFEPPQSFKAGYPEDYNVGEVNERFKDKYGVWIVHSDKGLYALSAICTHLGCTPVWLESEEKFKCPCHGSGYFKDGINFEGPAPRPLERFRITLAEDGQIFIDKTKVFHQEKGEWNNSGAILKVVSG